MEHQHFSGPLPDMDALDTEYANLRLQYVNYGFELPEDIAPPTFLSAVSKPFMPNETSPPQHLSGLPDGYAEYLSKTVHPALRRAAECGEPVALELARQVGRVTGANGMQGPLIHLDGVPVVIGEDSFFTDEQTIAHDFDTGLIVEYGMGLRGIFAHIGNIRQDRYGVHAIHKLHGEVAALQGILDFYDIGPEQMSLEAGGIVPAVDGLLDHGHGGKADLVIASRVHMAGDDLRYGIRHAGDLLREDGILLARGPRRMEPPSCGYDEIYQIVQEDEHLDVIVTKTIAAISSQDELEPTRLIVAEKLG